MALSEFADLREAAEQLCQLAGLFQGPLHQVRAANLRRAERNLITLESLFNDQLSIDLGTWSRSRKALLVLEEKRQALAALESESAESEARIAALNERLELWDALSREERQRINAQMQASAQYLANRTFQSEAHILHRYRRYQLLKPLSAYADNAEFLCDAIFHYENRGRYEENAIRLEKRIAAAEERLTSVRRGLLLASILCILIVTIPLCAPFAFSLWNRRREIERQIATASDTLKREERRLSEADEGVIAAQEIREVLGDVPLEDVRRTLAELRDLRAEFLRPERGMSATASLLSFLELYAPKLEVLFGNMPEDLTVKCSWLVEKMEALLHCEREIAMERTRSAALSAQIKNLLRGHGKAVLHSSVENLRERTQDFPLSRTPPALRSELAESLVQLPEDLRHARAVMSEASRGVSVPNIVWQRAGAQLQGHQNLIACWLLEAELTTPIQAAREESA